ncbi:MAG: hypothetical protein U9R74_10270 [Pseudomonadota bacterium]|nr:hypothetical protein [Pseudomonadota bacterium]
MKTATITTTLVSAAALALGITAASVSASDRGMILDEAVLDYAPESYTGPDVISHGDQRHVYTVEIDLDESFFDYDSSDMAAYYDGLDDLDNLEQAEIAAFEFHGGSTVETPWDLIPQD